MNYKVLENAFNIYESELGRTAYAWGLKFIHKFALVLGWTTIIALFVAKYSIVYLPVLFLAQAAIMVSGTIVHSLFADRLEVRNIIFFSALAASILLFFAGIYFGNDHVFFPLVLIANGFFIQQINLYLSSYIEEFFSPVEAVRVFPLIESAETAAGVTGGVVLASALIGGGGERVFFFWVILLIILNALLFLAHPKNARFYGYLLEMKVVPKAKRVNSGGIRKAIRHIAKTPFLQVMAAVFFIQWFVAQLIEFLYTKVVDERVLDGVSVEAHAEGLSHGLGTLHILFYCCALVVQLLIAGRILRFLGTVGGLLFHGLMTMMSAISMMLGFGYFTTVMAKNNFEVSGVISKNAYEASYYAFPQGTKKTIREFFEGFLAPMATIAGTIFLLVAGRFFMERDSLLMITMVLTMLTVLVVFLSLSLQKSYTGMVRKNLSAVQSRISKLHAIDILEQKGHLHGVDAMTAALKNEKDPKVMVGLLRALAKIGTLESVSAVERLFESEHQEVRLAAAEAIGSFKCLKSQKREITVTRHKMLDKLKNMYLGSDDDEFRLMLVRSLCSLEDGNIGGLLELLKVSDPVIKVECIDLLGNFHDVTAVDYLKPYCGDEDPFVRAKAIATILKIRKNDKQARSEAMEMIRSDDERNRWAAFTEFHSIFPGKLLPVMKKDLFSGDAETRLYAAMGLLNARYGKGAVVLADLLLSQNNLFFGRVKYMLKGLPLGMRKLTGGEIEKRMMTNAGLYWTKDGNIAQNLGMLGDELLKKIREAFKVVGLEEEAELIDAMIEYREHLGGARSRTEQSLVTENVI